MYFEDFKVGERFETPGRTLTEAEIILFASLYDYQTFHVDHEAAKESIYGGLIASGFHTLAIAWSLFLKLGLIMKSSMGSPGLNYVKWLAPVRPGDTLKVEVEVIDKKEASKRDRGLVVLRHRVKNQAGTTVLEYESVNIIARKT